MNHHISETNEDMQKEFNSELLEGMEQEFQTIMTDNELNELVSQLTCMHTVLPDESFVDELIQRWEQKEREDKLNASIIIEYSECKMHVFKKLRIVISHSHYTFLLQGLVFYLLGFIFLRNNTNIPVLFILPIISAIPFLLGTIGMIRWLANGMVELMMSLKLKLIWYMNTWFLLISIYSLLLNIILTFVLSNSGYSWRTLTLYWCIPGTLIASIAILLCIWLRDFWTLVGSYAVLPALCMFLLSDNNVQYFIENLNTVTLLIALALSSVFFAVTITNVTRHVQNGGVLIETRA